MITLRTSGDNSALRTLSQAAVPRGVHCSLVSVCTRESVPGGVHQGGYQDVYTRESTPGSSTAGTPPGSSTAGYTTRVSHQVHLPGYHTRYTYPGIPPTKREAITTRMVAVLP